MCDCLWSTRTSPDYRTGECWKVTNPYGQTKRIIEKILADICLAYSEWQITSLRYFNLIGVPKWHDR
ncbi:NAD-dependent epimerase/dehydratase family protein [Escherichia coli]|uniref:NAD-dependent epimerase/dehydratase family protein n=1 Tax=Escherichia coli TaxID=562 RepID=UPI003D647F57